MGYLGAIDPSRIGIVDGHGEDLILWVEHESVPIDTVGLSIVQSHLALVHL